MATKILPLSVLTVLVGLLIGCGSSNPYIGEVQSNLANDGNLEAALQSAEASIQNLPNDPLGYYFKGVVLGEMAQANEDIGERSATYEEMNAAFEQAVDVANQTGTMPGELENREAVKDALWQNEHNDGIRYATEDSVMATVDQPIQRAINHMVNATTIRPDSAISWGVLSEIYLIDEDYENAIAAKERELELRDNHEVEDYTRLASFHLQIDQYEEAIDVLQRGREMFPDDISIVEFMADAYMSMGEFATATDLVEELIRQNPNNPQYHLVLGTQYYQEVLNMNDSLTTNYDRLFELRQQLENASGSNAQQIQNEIATLEEANAQMQSRISTLTETATEELETVLEFNPDNATANYTLGVVYLNNASLLFEERNQPGVSDSEYNRLDSEAREYLRQAMGYYERAVELDPDNQTYWTDLFRVYVQLGMDEEAQEAAENAGME